MPTLREALTPILDRLEPYNLQADEVHSIELPSPPRAAIVRVTRACIQRIESDGGPLATVISAGNATCWRMSRCGVVLTALDQGGGAR